MRIPAFLAALLAAVPAFTTHTLAADAALVEAANHARGLQRTRRRVLGRAATLGAGCGFRRRQLFGEFGIVGATFKISGLRDRRRATGSGNLLQQLCTSISR